PSPRDSHNQLAREVVRRRAPAYKSDSACVRRAAGAQPDVRGVDPCKPNLAPNRDQRIRVETDRGITQRTRQRVQGTHGISCAKRVPSTNLQQTRDLTSRALLWRSTMLASNQHAAQE